MGSVPRDGKPIKLNSAFHTLCLILRCAVASAAEAELGALFMNCQEGMIFKATLKILDIPNHQYRYTATMQQQSASRITPLKAKDCVQWKWSISEHVKKMHRKYFCLSGTPGRKILRTTKAKPPRWTSHGGKTYYLHEKNSPLELPCAIQKSTLKGCVGTLKDGYVRSVPLPRVPRIQSAKLIAPSWCSQMGTPLPD